MQQQQALVCRSGTWVAACLVQLFQNMAERQQCNISFGNNLIRAQFDLLAHSILLNSIESVLCHSLNNMFDKNKTKKILSERASERASERSNQCASPNY